MHKLQWNDRQIPHQIFLEPVGLTQTRIHMTIIKDVEPEALQLTVDSPVEQLQTVWSGSALPISDAYDDGSLYSQTRCLFNLEKSCIIWTVNHIKLPSGEKMSTDKLALIPGMNARNGKLQAT